GAALDVLFFGQEALQLRIDLDDRSFLVDGRIGGRVPAGGGRGRQPHPGGLAEIGATPSATGRDNPAGTALTGCFADRHGRFPVDLFLGRGLVGEDVAL